MRRILSCLACIALLLFAKSTDVSGGIITVDSKQVQADTFSEILVLSGSFPRITDNPSTTTRQQFGDTATNSSHVQFPSVNPFDVVSANSMSTMDRIGDVFTGQGIATTNGMTIDDRLQAGSIALWSLLFTLDSSYDYELTGELSHELNVFDGVNNNWSRFLLRDRDLPFGDSIIDQQFLPAGGGTQAVSRSGTLGPGRYIFTAQAGADSSLQFGPGFPVNADSTASFDLRLELTPAAASPVPEPDSIFLFCIGLAAVIAYAVSRTVSPAARPAEALPKFGVGR